MRYDISTFEKVEPCYTGGGIYCVVGRLTDGNYFMGDITFEWIAIVNEKPDWDDSWYEEWIDAHRVEEFCDSDARCFIRHAIEWVKEKKPDGNYLMSELEDILEEL